MKLLYTACAFLLLAIGCSGPTKPSPPPPPPPVVVKDFKVTGKTVIIEGKIKEGNTLQVEDVVLHMGTAVDMLDK